MRRPTLLAAMLVTLAAAAPAAAFTPVHGHYTGTTDRHTTVTFRYVGHRLLDVRVGGVWAINEAYVSTHGWSFHDREYHHELRGHWTDSRHVTGTYGYYRQTSRGLVHVTTRWTAHLG